MVGKNYALIIGSLALTNLLGACGGRQHQGQGDVRIPDGDVKASADQHTVMVIDTGFDPDNSEFAGKITARYTLSCKAADDADSTDTGKLSTKEKLIAELQVAANNCLFQAGTTPNISAAFTGIAGYRDAWNRYWQSKGTDRQAGDAVYFHQTDITKVLNDEAHLYHGTATAGSIVYKNPKAMLVLVEAPLSSPNAKPTVASCPYTTSVLQSTVDLLNDADVQKAFINRPVSSEDKQLADLIAKHNVDLINESFGTNANATLIKQLKKYCFLNSDLDKLVDLFTQMQKLKGSLAVQRQKVLDQQLPGQTKALVIKSAGNDGAVTNSSDDLTDCGTRSEHEWLIGAIDDERKVASFSNRGDCVDAYALGKNVLVPAPRNFVNVEDGTSFSSPLFVRWITLQLAPGQSPKAMADQMRSKLDGNRYVPADAVPEELAFDHQGTLMDGFGFAGDQAASADRQLALPTRVKPLPARTF